MNFKNHGRQTQKQMAVGRVPTVTYMLKSRKPTDPSRIASILDAGLLHKAKPDQRIAVAVHVTSPPLGTSSRESKMQGSWASELECLADLVEMGNTREASEMAIHIAATNKEISTPH